MYKFRRGLKIYIVSVIIWGLFVGAFLTVGAVSGNIDPIWAIGVMGGYIVIFSLLSLTLPRAVITQEKIFLKRKEYFFDDIKEIRVRRLNIKDEGIGADEITSSGSELAEALFFYIIITAVSMGIYYLLLKIFSKSKILATYSIFILNGTSFNANGRAVDFIESIAKSKGIKFTVCKPKKRKKHNKKPQ